MIVTQLVRGGSRIRHNYIDDKSSKINIIK